MAFPQTPIDVLAEMQIGGVWTDITGDLYARAPLTIQRGRQDEGARVDSSRANFQLDNREMRYSPRSPTSPNYGLIGRNTPVRFSVAGAESYLELDGDIANTASTPDHASFAVTDLDVRMEVSPDWYASGINQTVTGQWGADGDRAWTVRFLNSFIVLTWTPTGLSADALSFSRAIPDMPTSRRGAIRYTLDVNNGAGGHTITGYYADSLAGPWVAFDTTTTAGTTSIFNSASPLEIGPTQAGSTPLRRPIRGRVHRVEVRNGIGGSVVASPDFRARTPGTTSFADGAGRTWTVNGSARITNREYRLTAEVSSWPPRWDVSEQDRYVPIEASGILRRLGQGAKALDSTLRRRIPTFSPVAYWPLEEGRDATQAYSPIDGVPALRVGGLEFASDDSCPGSSALPKASGGALLQGPVPLYTSATSGYLVACVYAIAAPPAGSAQFLQFTTSGTARRITVTLTATLVQLRGYDQDGALVHSDDGSITGFTGPGRWFRFDLTAQQNGGAVDFHLGWVDVEGGGFQANSTMAAGSVGRVTSVNTSIGTLLADMRIGHLGVYPSSDTSIWGTSDNGYRGEAHSFRMLRLAGEEGVPLSLSAQPWVAATRLGPQRPNSLLTLLDESAAADIGVLFEDRERLELRYRDRRTYYNQDPVLTLNYAGSNEIAPPLEPVDDDQHLRNDVTITRTGGSSARARQETGPLSVQAPPLGVGVYDEALTLNLYDDTQPLGAAGWRVHLGTWDEPRTPTVHIDLAAAPHLIPTVLGLDIGDRIQITSTPAWLPPGPLDLIVEGWTETIGHPTDWDIVLNCSPAGPWTVAVVDDAIRGRVETSGSVLARAATSTATTLAVHSVQAETDMPLWTVDAADYPQPLLVAGEAVTATAAPVPMAADSFTRTVAAGSWGTSSDGHAWTLAGGSNSERSVASNRGVVTIAATQTTLRAQTVAEDCQDCDVLVSVAVSQTSTGGSQTPSILMRYQNTTDNYRVRCHFTTGGNISLSVTRGSTQIDTNVSTGYSYAPGDLIRVRARLIGHRVLAKAWPAAAAAEPPDWQIDRTVVSSTIDSGTVGLGAVSLSGNTNTGEHRFDDFSIPTPQRFTSVARSVNGITKAQAAGATVGVAIPAVVAL